MAEPDPGAAPTGPGRWPALGALVAAALSWGAQGTVVVLILDRAETDGLTLGTIRALTATLLLWTGLGLVRRSDLRLPRSALASFVPFGVVTVTVLYLASIYAYERASVAVATTLLYLSPALVALVAVRFLGEPLTGAKVAALALTFGGCLLMVRAYEPGKLAAGGDGIGLGLLAAASFACYSLYGKRLLRRHGPATVLAYGLLCGAVALVAIKLIVSPAAWPTPAGTLAIGVATLATTVAPWTLYTVGLRWVPASEASIVVTLELVVSVVLAAAILDESLARPQWLGAVGVAVGVALLASSGRVREAARPVAGTRRESGS